MKMMEFDISGVRNVEEIIIALWNAPETSKTISQEAAEDPLLTEEARLILQAADPNRTGIVRLDVLKRPSKEASPCNPQYSYQPNQYRRGVNTKTQANVRHFYVTLRGRWRASKLHPGKDSFQALRLQFRMNRQGNSFFKYHDPNLARQILVGEFKAIELVDRLEEDELEDYPEYVSLLRRVDHQAVLFVRSLLSDYFKQEKPTARKVKTNRFLGMRKQNTFYTKPAQTGHSLNTLTLMKTAFLVQLRAAVQKRVETIDFYDIAQPGSECFKRLQCSYLVLGAELDMLLEDLNNKNHYRAHADPKPVLAEMSGGDLEDSSNYFMPDDEEDDEGGELPFTDADFPEMDFDAVEEEEGDNVGNRIVTVVSERD